MQTKKPNFRRVYRAIHTAITIRPDGCNHLTARAVRIAIQQGWDQRYPLRRFITGGSVWNKIYVARNSRDWNSL